MPVPVSQVEYVTYQRCLAEVGLVEKYCRKGQLSRIGFLDGHFVKLPKEGSAPGKYATLFERFPGAPLNELENTIRTVNAVHLKLKEGQLGERKNGDCAPLAAHLYNTSLQVISAWNIRFKESQMQIDLPTASLEQLGLKLSDKTSAQENDEKALARYFELLGKYPKLRRKDGLNDHRAGVYEVIYDKERLLAAHKAIHRKLYDRAISQELTDSEANELASNYSRPGVIHEDQYWLWIRDVVTAPSTITHTYNRIVWKCDLDKVGGAAALPIVKHSEDTKIILELTFRHATNSWEFEMPRGGTKVGETPIDAAKREIWEETGCVVDRVFQLGTVNPDSGLTASEVPVFVGTVIAEGEARQDKTEAIKGKYPFTLAEIMDGFRRGFIEVKINDIPTQVPMRDPFLAYALLMAKDGNYL